MSRNAIEEIRQTFTKFAEGKIQPHNFGRALTHAVRDGFLEKDYVSKLLGVKPEQILKTGNCLKGREIQKISTTIINREP